MSMTKVWSSLFIVALCGCTSLCSSAQKQLEALREIKLPVSSPGVIGRSFPTLGAAAKDLFSIKVAPDQSLLVCDPEANGQWVLVRVKKWWTAAPVSEVLNFPGWSKDNPKNGDLKVDFQITSDGHYGVVFAAAEWWGPILFKPRNYVPHKPDTLITVIDLQRWKVIGSTHMAELEGTDFRGARVLNGNWMALQGFEENPPSRPHEHLYERRNRLISIPDLKPGPECISQRPGVYFPEGGTPAAERKRHADALSRSNDAACTEVLETAGMESVKTLESMIYKGHGLEPRVLMLQSLGIKDEAELDGDKTRFPTNLDEREEFFYYRSWSDFNYQMYAISSPFESSSHLWYGLNLSRHSTVSMFDADGRKVREQSAPELLCGVPKERGWPPGACGCHIEDVSDEQHVMLAYCRIQRGDFDGGFLKQWLAVARSDDMTEVGFVSLSKDRAQGAPPEAISVVDGRAYVLAVEFGQTVRVYAVPGRAESTP